MLDGIKEEIQDLFDIERMADVGFHRDPANGSISHRTSYYKKCGPGHLFELQQHSPWLSRVGGLEFIRGEFPIHEETRLDQSIDSAFDPFSLALQQEGRDFNDWYQKTKADTFGSTIVARQLEEIDGKADLGLLRSVADRQGSLEQARNNVVPSLELVGHIAARTRHSYQQVRSDDDTFIESWPKVSDFHQSLYKALTTHNDFAAAKIQNRSAKTIELWNIGNPDPQQDLADVLETLHLGNTEAKVVKHAKLFEDARAKLRKDFPESTEQSWSLRRLVQAIEANEAESTSDILPADTVGETELGPVQSPSDKCDEISSGLKTAPDPSVANSQVRHNVPDKLTAQNLRYQKFEEEIQAVRNRRPRRHIQASAAQARRHRLCRKVYEDSRSS